MGEPRFPGLEATRKFVTVLSPIIAVIGAILSLARQIGGLTYLGVACTAATIALLSATFVYLARFPSALAPGHRVPSYSSRHQALAMVALLISGVVVVHAAREAVVGRVPESVTILLVNRTGESMRLAREARLVLTRAESPIADLVVLTGILDLTSEEEKLDGPYIRISGVNTKVRAQLRNRAHFHAYYRAGDLNAQVILEADRGLYRETVPFRRRDFGTLVWFQIARTRSRNGFRTEA